MPTVSLPIALALATATMLAAWWWVRRLPEPDDLDHDKPPYRQLGLSWQVVSIAIGLALVAASHPQPLAWAWWAWASLGAVLVTVDLLTTYLPLRLQWTMTAVLLVGLLVPALVTGQPRILSGAALGAAVTGGGFWLLWRFSRSFGFGDVRLAFTLGALTGAHGASFWYTAVLAGTALGAVAAVIVLLWRRRHPSSLGTGFAYGPALWAGPWLALLLS